MDDSDHSIPDIIDHIGNLPSPSPVFRRILMVMENATSSAQDLVDALKLDPVIVGKVLKLANSAYIGVPRTISSIQNAVVLLGLKRIRSLILSSSLLSAFRIPISDAFSLQNFWRHSIVVGAIAESIAKHLRRYNPIEPEEVFAAAIMHDIGKLVLAGHDPARLTRAIAKGRNESIPFYEAEDATFSHVRIGKFLADHWQFPRDIACGILYHHEPAQSEAFVRQTGIIHLADVMAHGVGFHSCLNELSPAPDPGVLASLPLPFERLKVIAEEVMQREQELESLVSTFT